MTHICVSKIISIGSDNGLSPGRRQAIIWTSAGILSIGPLGTNFSENWIKVHTFSFKKMHLKMSSGKWRPCCLGLNVLTKKHISGMYYTKERLGNEVTFFATLVAWLVNINNPLNIQVSLSCCLNSYMYFIQTLHNSFCYSHFCSNPTSFDPVNF